MTLKQFVRFIVGLGFATFFIWLVVRQINLAELKQAFLETQLTWVYGGLTAFMCGYACRIQRWCLMLQRDNPNLRWRQCAGPLLSSFAANNVLPFRAGDVLRAFAFNNRLALSAGVIVATLFVERLLDLLMVLLLFAIALMVFNLQISRFVPIGSAALIAMGGGILMLLLFPRLFAPTLRYAGRLVMGFVPTIGVKLCHEIDKSLTTLMQLANGGVMLKLLVWSVAAWLFEGGVFWCAAKALHAITVTKSGWLALPVGTLATLIPSTPGYVGTFDYFTVQAMVIMGNQTSAAAAYALLVHTLLWLPPTLLGGIYLLLHPVHKQINSKEPLP